MLYSNLEEQSYQEEKFWNGRQFAGFCFVFLTQKQQQNTTENKNFPGMTNLQSHDFLSGSKIERETHLLGETMPFNTFLIEYFTQRGQAEGKKE